jgi:hypothetical protein
MTKKITNTNDHILTENSKIQFIYSALNSHSHIRQQLFLIIAHENKDSSPCHFFSRQILTLLFVELFFHKTGFKYFWGLLLLCSWLVKLCILLKNIWNIYFWIFIFDSVKICVLRAIAIVSDTCSIID